MNFSNCEALGWKSMTLHRDIKDGLFAGEANQTPASNSSTGSKAISSQFSTF